MPSTLRQELLPIYLGGRLFPPVAVLAAYFDESRRLERVVGATHLRIITMAGYIGTVELWDRDFSPPWRAVIEQAPHRITEFKASDCRQGTGEFEPPWTSGERLALMTDLVSVVVNAPEQFVGIGAAHLFDPNYVSSPEEERAITDRCWLECFTTVAADALNISHTLLGNSEHVQFVFDEEKDLEARAREWWGNITEVFAPDLVSRVRRPHFSPSHLVEPLQAADLLAHETAKEMENRLATPPRKPSVALERLVAGKVHWAGYYYHLTMQEIERRHQEGRLSDLPGGGCIYDTGNYGGVVRNVFT